MCVREYLLELLHQSTKTIVCVNEKERFFFSPEHEDTIVSTHVRVSRISPKPAQQKIAYRADF